MKGKTRQLGRSCRLIVVCKQQQKKPVRDYGYVSVACTKAYIAINSSIKSKRMCLTLSEEGRKTVRILMIAMSMSELLYLYRLVLSVYMCKFLSTLSTNEKHKRPTNKPAEIPYIKCVQHEKRGGPTVCCVPRSKEPYISWFFPFDKRRKESCSCWLSS